MISRRAIVTYPKLLPVVTYQYFEDEALDAAWLPPTPPPFYARSKFAELIWCRFLSHHDWVIKSSDWNTQAPARSECCVSCGKTRIELLNF